MHFEAKRGQIRGLTYSKFAQDREIQIQLYKESACSTPEKVIARAVSRLGQDGYSFFGNNCEHFAHWCKTGKHTSEQVKGAVEIVGAMGGGVLVGAAAVSYR